MSPVHRSLAGDVLAAGPVSIHVVDGEIEVTAGGESRAYSTGTVVTFDRRIRHAVSSSGGAVFLLTLAAPTTTAEPR